MRDRDRLGSFSRRHSPLSCRLCGDRRLGIEAGARAVTGDRQALVLRRSLLPFPERRARGPLDAHQEMQRLAQLYRDAASWFERHGAGYCLGDHADALFVEITFRIPAARYLDQANRWARRIAQAEPALTQTLLADHRRLAARFQADLTSFERKRFDNLSHEPNKAMNLNSYISLMGQHRRVVDFCSSVLLEPAEAAEASLSVPNPDYVLMVDADSLISPDYSLRLACVLA